MDGPLSLIPDGGLPDPGAAGPWRVSTRHGELSDPDRARTLPFKLYLPDAPRPGGLILFSHGLGGTREGGALWLRHWASHGFAALAVQHPGSDASVLGAGSPLGLRRALKAAMNPAELARRADDIRYVLGRLGHDPQLPDAGLPIGLAGHSFGAVTVQLLAGERRAGHPATPPDPRLRATLALSPSARQPDAPPGLAQRFAQRFTTGDSHRLQHGRDESVHPPMLPAAVPKADWAPFRTATPLLKTTPLPLASVLPCPEASASSLPRLKGQ